MGVSIIEWYRASGDLYLNAEACALKYAQTTSLKKAYSSRLFESVVILPSEPIVSFPVMKLTYDKVLIGKKFIERVITPSSCL